MDHDRTAAPRSSRLARRAAVLALVAAAGVNGGCETPRIPGVYRMDVQQGNAVDREMLDRIEIGMDRGKVRFILGTPLLADPFHQDRWDYIYSFRTGSEPTVRQRVSLYFTDDRLVRIEDTSLPRGCRGRRPNASRPWSGYRSAATGRDSWAASSRISSSGTSGRRTIPPRATRRR